jgi:hypothetical protein
MLARHMSTILVLNDYGIFYMDLKYVSMTFVYNLLLGIILYINNFI